VSDKWLKMLCPGIGSAVAAELVGADGRVTCASCLRTVGVVDGKLVRHRSGRGRHRLPRRPLK
jgi:hypothetical protein